MQRRMYFRIIPESNGRVFLGKLTENKKLGENLFFKWSEIKKIWFIIVYVLQVKLCSRII